MDFRVLGPLEVRDGDALLRLGGRRQRSLLAVLLLNAGEVVSADRLLDAVWAGDVADDGALHAQISRLRKVLEPDRNGDPVLLLTEAPGYRLQVEPGQIDLVRFDRLADEGRRALAAGQPEQAARRLRDALALWRGRPLADLEDEPFRRDAAQRLDERRLDAIEARVEADLACGRDDELVPELRALVGDEPLRERLRGQLMLALYRAGRQSEALEAYAAGRQMLASELGLAPGRALQQLQEQILAQDPALDLRPPAAEHAVAPPRRPGERGPRRATVAVVVAATGVTVALALLILVLAGGDDERGPAGAAAGALSGGAVTALGSNGEAGDRIAVGSTATAVAAGEGAVWVVDADEQTVSSIDTGSHAVTTFATGSTPTGVAVGAGSVWVATGTRTARGQVRGAATSGVVRVDPATRTVRARIDLPSPRRALAHGADGSIAVGAGAIWAIAADGAVARIDPRTDEVTGIVRGVQARDVAAGAEGVWVLGDDGTVARIDPARARYGQRLKVKASSVGALAVGGGSAWVTAPGDGRLWRIDAGPAFSARAIPVGAGVTDVAYAGDRVWLANALRGTVVRVDPAREGVVRETPLGGMPRAIAATDGGLWVASSGETRAASAAESGGVAAARCSPVVTGGGGAPDRLVVADLPLQGGLRLSAQQVEQAMLFTLRERGFRAGRFRVGFQSCDDSIGRTGIFDEAKCVSNARAYVREPAVVGVLGYLNTPCAAAAVPVLNRASLAALSTLASSPALTRGAEARRLFPTGRRTFLRVYPSDDYEAVALARVAAQEHARSVAVLDDGDPTYGRMLADRFAATAGALGLDVALRASWDPQANSFAALARRVAAARPDAVFLGGLLDTQGAEVLGTLHARLGNRVLRLLPSGFTPSPFLTARAGRAAEGAYLSLSGVIPESLPRAGQRFVRRFAPTQPGVGIEPSAVYAAESTAVMLEALARSDGSRASVVEQLFATRRRGLLGELSFDAAGDVRSTPVTILRVERGRRRLQGLDDTVLDRVVR